MHKQKGKYRYLSVGGVGQYKQKEKYLLVGSGAIEILSFGSYTGTQELGGIRVWSGHQQWCVGGQLLTPFSSQGERPNLEIRTIVLSK